VLVTGAAGGVGRFAVQLAHRGGAEVTAIVGSPARAAGLRELGADRVVVEPELPPGRYDLILESAGGGSLTRLLPLIEAEGTLAMFGNTSNGTATLDPRPLFLRGVRIVGSSLSHSMARKPPARDLAYLAGLVAAGELDPQIAMVLPWTDAAAAIGKLLGRTIAGKAILTLKGG
jgi:NADPH:quinone reductase-like Zn-dependent oxidoreductase